MNRHRASISLVAFVVAPCALGQQVLFETHGTHSEVVGYAVAAPGDLDGDGRPDVVVAGPGDYGGGPPFGAISAYSSSNGQLLWQRFPGGPFEQIGYTVEALGDWNSDGVSDIGVGVVSTGQPGRVRVLSGTDGAVLSEMTTTSPDFKNGIGRSFCGADVDLDGAPDLIAWAPSAKTLGLEMTGAVCVFSGATGVLVHTIAPSSYSYDFGRAVTAAGDWNQDGAPDFAFARSYSNPKWEGVDVIGGNGYALLAQLKMPSPQFAPTVSGIEGIGDFDGDGADDLAISTSGTYVAPFSNGGFAIFRGGHGTVMQIVQDGADPAFGSRIASIGDLDGDAISDIAVLAEYLEDSASVSVWSSGSGAELMHIPGVPQFGSALAGVGDWNGDGSPDLAIGTIGFGKTPTSTAGGFLGVYSLAGSPTCSTFTAYGPKCGTDVHKAPELGVSGCPGAGGPLRIAFSPATFVPPASAFLMVGTQSVSIPISGNGCRLLVGPVPGLLIGPLPLGFPIVASFDGAYDFVLPTPLYSGNYNLQIFMTDGMELVASNGVSFTVQ